MTRYTHHRHLTALLCALCLLASACAETPDGSEPVDERTRVCGQQLGPPQVAIIRKLDFVEAEGSVSQGLDLDGITSEQGGDTGCTWADFTDADGNEGIDNQFALLVPVIRNIVGDGFDAVILRAINEGAVLLMLDVQRLNDPAEDQCVEVTVWRGEGRPALDASGYIEQGQTFDLKQDASFSYVPDGTAKDGWIEAGPIQLQVPFELSGFELLVSIRNARMRFQIDEEGNMKGIIAGSLVVAEMLELLDTVSANPTDRPLFRIIGNTMRRYADLNPNEAGSCTELSITMEFEASTAFFFADQSFPDRTVAPMSPDAQ